MQWLICIAWLIVVWVKRIHFIIKNHHLRLCRSHWRLSLRRTTMKSFFPPQNFPEIKIHSLLLWRKYLAFLWHGEERRRKKRLQAMRKCRSWCWLNKISVSHSCWGRNENENWKEGEKRRIKWRTAAEFVGFKVGFSGFYDKHFPAFIFAVNRAINDDRCSMTFEKINLYANEFPSFSLPFYWLNKSRSNLRFIFVPRCRK